MDAPATQTMNPVMLDHRTLVMARSSNKGRLRLDEYKKLKDEGILIQLDLKGRSIFATSVDWGELGITAATAQKYMTRGRKMLFDPDLVAKLISCIVKMQQALANHTPNDIPGIAPYRYLHYKFYQSWNETWDRLNEELEEIRQEMLDRYEEVRDVIAAEYTVIAQEAWGEGDKAHDNLIFAGYNYTDRDLFVDAVVANALAKMPSREDIQNKISATYRTSVIQGIEDIAQAEARAAKLAAEAEALAAQARLDAQEREQRLDHEQRIMALEEEEKRVKIRAMYEAEAARIREELAATTSPLEGAFRQVRQRMMHEANEILGIINKNGGKLPNRSAKRALNTMAEIFKMQTIVDDDRMRERFDALVSAIGPVEDQPADAPARSVDQVKDALEKIAGLVDSAHQDFLAGPSRFDNLDLD